MESRPMDIASMRINNLIKAKRNVLVDYFKAHKVDGRVLPDLENHLLSLSRPELVRWSYKAIELLEEFWLLKRLSAMGVNGRGLFIGFREIPEGDYFGTRTINSINGLLSRLR